MAWNGAEVTLGAFRMAMRRAAIGLRQSDTFRADGATRRGAPAGL
jgi:hypothetical protein